MSDHITAAKDNLPEPIQFINKKFSLKNRWTKLTHWEFWPFYLLYIPVFIYWAWLIIKSRAIFFFSTSNPGIENGGMLGESKFKIFELIDEDLKPKTLYFKPGAGSPEIRKAMLEKQIDFPVIVKPDIGERGSFVQKLENETGLKNYLSIIKVPFLIQEFIDYPIELGVFYYRYPSKPDGQVSSVVLKDFMAVEGDGIKTIVQLLKEKSRAMLYMDGLIAKENIPFHKVLDKNEKLILEPIGNHCRGTTFLNANYLIDSQLIDVFNKIAKGIKGFYYGRFDIKSKSIEDLKAGRHIKILELNGAGSEPGHIYHPGTSLIKAYQAIFHHLNILQKVSRENHQRGIPYMTTRQGIKEIRKLRAHNKLKNS